MNRPWLLRGAVAAVLALACWLGWQQVRPAERVGDVPYVPTRVAVVDRMLELAGIGAGDLLLDLGSGDGRIVIRAAQRHQARARGVEIDPLLVRESRAAAVRAGVGDRVEIVAGDLFDAPLGDADAVTLFLLPSVNRALRPRLLAGLQPGTPVVSHMWDMGAWQPDLHETIPLQPPADVYLWIVPAGFGGVWEGELQPIPEVLDPGQATGTPAASGTGIVSAPPVPGTGTGPEQTPGPFPGGRFELRLLQRFQEVEGELQVGDRVVTASGRVRGTEVEIVARPSPAELGEVKLSATVEGDRLEGTATASPWPSPVPFVAIRRPAPPLGTWQVASQEGGVPQWTMRWSPSAPGWQVVRWRDNADPETDATRLPGADPGPAADAATGPDLEAWVWGGALGFAVPAADDSGRQVLYFGLVQDDTIIGTAQDGGTQVRWFARRSPSAGRERGPRR